MKKSTQSAIKSLGLVLKFLKPLSYTKHHTIVYLLLAKKKKILVDLEQRSVCQFSTDHKLYSLHLWNFAGFCKSLPVLIYSRLKEKTSGQIKVSDFPEYQYCHFNFSQFVIVELNSRKKKMWVSLSVLSYLCSVWYRQCCQDLQSTQQSKRSSPQELFLGVYIQESVKPT